jgi:ureidoacrylate peracid hydrolase
MPKPLDFDPARAAVLTIDLQNDFLHPKGAYGRAGQGSDALRALPGKVRAVVDAVRKARGVYVSAQFTLVPGPGGEPLIAPHLKALRPFLGKGDFCPGTFGHDLVADLAPADYTVEKVAYSAFHQTRLEYVLRAIGVEMLIVGGIVTNGGVASTVRDAHVRNIETILLGDGCGAFQPKVHEATLISLGSLTHVMTCAEAVAMIARAAP